MISSISVLKRGPIMYNDRIICNRIGPTPEVVKEDGEQIGVQTLNSYTISRASPGILLSFFSIQGELSEENKEMKWFSRGDRHYFLTTSTKLDGWKSSWKGHSTFGTIIKQDHAASLNPYYAWTFFLSFATGKYVISTVWDIDNQCFITPNKWNVDDKLMPTFLTYSIGTLSPNCTDTIINTGIPIKIGEPLIVMIYCGSTIKTVKVFSKEDVYMSIIMARSTDKYEALLIAMFKGEKTGYFEKKKFTPQELYQFRDRCKRGKQRFLAQIYEKDKLKKYVFFPDKLYNCISLGDILADQTLTVVEKQKLAWSKLLECGKHKQRFKIQAICAFYASYVVNCE